MMIAVTIQPDSYLPSPYFINVMTGLISPPFEPEAMEIKIPIITANPQPAEMAIHPAL